MKHLSVSNSSTLLRAAAGLLALSSFGLACAALGGDGRSDSDLMGKAGTEEATEAPDGSVDAAPPRRVCPSARNPDGSWVTVDGFDVSDYQYTDWDKVASASPNHKYAFARVSAGLVRVDKRFSIDWAGAKRVGLIRGAYQYFKPSQSSIAQADLFLRRMNEVGGFEATDFPPVLDVETTNDMPTETVVCRVKTWLARVERATNRVPIIYTSERHSFLFAREFSRYPLWVANYVGTPSVTCPRMPAAWDKWHFWQWSESGKVNGVYTNANRDDDAGGSILMDGGVPVFSGYDVNFWDGTLSDLRSYIASSVSPGNVVGA